ncbi:MAG: 26S proteasome regulatory subunit [Chaenotheca gracillima]|nr:MAG: 26S proteasome regulatory subunit [Chaenotheca gracillima]
MDAMAADPTGIALAPAKMHKLKAVNASTGPAYGCEHLQKLFSADPKTTHLSLRNYVQLLAVLYDKSRVVAQSSTPLEEGGRSITSLRPTYLCLQCPSISTLKESEKHWKTRKHCFAMESRSGCLYCYSCEDFVYDMSLEDMRLQRDMSTSRRKRKLEELYPTPEDMRYVNSNSSAPPCRAVGLRGVFNMGATCYMSVILQSLIHNPLLRNYYLSDGHKSVDCERENCMSCSIDEMFSELYNSEKMDAFGAVNVLGRLWHRKPAMAGYKQQDAHEFFQFLVDQLHIESKEDVGDEVSDDGEQCSCIIHKTYYGRLRSDVTCRNCNSVNTTEEPMIDLSLDLRSTNRKKKLSKEELDKINSKLNLQSCLEGFTAPEKLGGDAYKCKKCNTTQHPATKQLSIRRLPPVLCIQLKRFEAGFDAASVSSKLDAKVEFPVQLDMSPYTTRVINAKKPDPQAFSLLSRTCTYDLCSVVVHIGNLNDGHYVSYHREGRDWYLFDDNKVLKTTEARVMNAEAYLLVYTIRSLA